MRRIGWIAILTACLAAAGAARAEDKPVLAPTRDVTVTYQVLGAPAITGAAVIKMTYADHDRKVRLDFYSVAVAQTPFGSLIFDEPENEVLSLTQSDHSYTRVQAIGRANPGLMLGAGMQYKREGTATVAGRACTIWEVSDGPMDKGTVCVTADGVVLRGNHTTPQPGGLEAIAVAYETPPDSIFHPDPGMEQRHPDWPKLPAHPSR